MKSISLYVDNGTWLTKVHPFTKLLYVLTAILIPVILGSHLSFALMICASICILASAKILRKAMPLIAFSFTIILVVFIIHGLFHHGNTTPLLTLGRVVFYREGVLYALGIGLNIWNMLMAFATFVLSTKPQDLVDEMERVGFSAKFGYIINSVFQIIPQMMGTTNTIMDAQRSRGMETEGRLSVRAKAFLPLISPVVMSSLINTRERAIALSVRGFETPRKKTYLKTRVKRTSDRLLNCVMVIAIAASIVWRVVR